MTRHRGFGDLQQNTGNSGTRDAHEHRDPVCGMPVAEHTGFHSSHGGKDFYFCGSTCQQDFERDPERYTGRNSGGEPSGYAGGKGGYRAGRDFGKNL